MGSQSGGQGFETVRTNGSEDDRRRARERRRGEISRKYDFGVVRHLRQQLGLTIERFAELCGVSYAPISRIEGNLIKPNLETLDRIAGGLGISTHALLAQAERRPPAVAALAPATLPGIEVRSLELPGAAHHLLRLERGATFCVADLGGAGEATFILQSGRGALQVGDHLVEIEGGEAAVFHTDQGDTIRIFEPACAVLCVRTGSGPSGATGAGAL